jgi:hypothetical protein
LAAGGIVLGFLQRQDDIDGFYQSFHGGLEWASAADSALLPGVIDADEGHPG